jgi:outer membrane translocation and assembly module TamA
LKTILAFFLAVSACLAQDSTVHTPKIQKLVKVFTGNKYLISPFVFYMPETNWVIGGGIKRFFNAGGEGDSLTRISNTSVFVQYSLNHQLMFEHNYQVFTNNEKYYILGYYGFNRFPINYYGVGKNAKLENKELVSFDHIRFDNLTLRKIANGLFAGIGWRYFKTFHVTGENGVLEQSKVSGYQGSIASGPKLALLFDNRDNVLTPSAGFYAQVEWTGHRSYWGSTHAFNRTMLDLRMYWKPITHRDDVIGLQSFVQLMTGNIPFNELSQLGGDMIMRGYYQGSFRDNNLFATQAEYRYQVLKRWGLVGFIGLGGVNNTLSDMNSLEWKPSYGGGLRFKINRKENVNVRVDYGFGNGQQNLYFFIAESF